MKSANYILTTEVLIKPDDAEKVIKLWQKEFSCHNASLHMSLDQASLLELRAFNDISGVIDLLQTNKENKFEVLTKYIGQYLLSDYKQELLVYKEEVVPQQEPLPAGEFVQLRHIEVPLSVYEEYLQWRADTIFKHVKQLPTVKSFVAYHSLLSKQPGVMFLSSFSCDPEEYSQGFTNPTYSKIVKEAGNKFIAGGEGGLYTKIYKKV